MIPVSGWLKNEVGERYYLLPFVAMTDLGIKVREWVGQLLQMQHIQGRLHGAVFIQRNDKPAWEADFEGELMNHLQRVKDTRVGLISTNVNIFDEYRISNSF